MDEFLIAIKQKLPTCSATGLNNIISALPAMGSGYRLNEVVREAVSRYDALMSAQQYSGAAAVEAADQQQYEAMAAAEAQPVA
jgi:tartrate dehydratase alpha subunit/fumarate hydratase class I-like protein